MAFLQRAGWTLALGALAAMSGCVRVKPPTMMAEGFQPSTVDTLVLLPVADHRIDKSARVNFEEWVLPIATHNLRRKKYPFVVERDRTYAERVSSSMLESPPGDWISAVGPQGSRWVMLLVMEDVRSGGTFGGTANVEMSGYIFDKGRKMLVWRNKELVRHGLAGGFGIILRDDIKRDAIQEATIQMLRALPLHH